MRSASADRSNRSGKPEVEGATQDLASFRYNLRRFLRFSEKAARSCRVTPQQHQMMLGVAGFTGRGSATISELAEFLQERHNSVVGLVERAELRGLVRRDRNAMDRRLAVVSLTQSGREILSRLSELHAEELRHARMSFVSNRKLRSQVPATKGGKERPAFSLTLEQLPGSHTHGSRPQRRLSSNGTSDKRACRGGKKTGKKQMPERRVDSGTGQAGQ